MGAAVERADWVREWWLEGVKLSEAEHAELAAAYLAARPGIRRRESDLAEHEGK